MLSVDDRETGSVHGGGEDSREEEREGEEEERISSQGQVEMMKSAFLNSLEKMTETLQSIEMRSNLTPILLPHLFLLLLITSLFIRSLPRQQPEQQEAEKYAPTPKCSSENILLWKNIGKYVTSQNENGKELKLLHNVSGRAKAGEIVAIMGQSGCGKSTLLNLLSGHYSKGMEGSIYLNDERLTCALRRKIAYVSQSDTFYEDLTVDEHILYSAQLYLSGSHSFDKISEYVDRVLRELHLHYIKEYQLKVLSGGQRKRSSIGACLVSMPEFLLLDGKTKFFLVIVYSP